MKYSKKMLRACWYTLRAYQRLVRDPGGEYGEWEDYGGCDGCRLCKVRGVEMLGDMDKKCPYCPLFLNGCLCCGPTMSRLRDELSLAHWPPYYSLRQAAIVRWIWVQRRLYDNGVTVAKMRAAARR